MKRAVITGATGVLGRALVNECLRQRYEVLTITHRGSKRADELKGLPHLNLMEADLSKYKSAIDNLDETAHEWLRCTEKADTSDSGAVVPFFHLAWKSTTGSGAKDPHIQAENVQTACDAVRLAHALGCNTFVFAGSQAEYGRKTEVLCADTEARPETAYGKAKYEAGLETKKLCESLGIRHIWVRILSVYGPYDRPNAVLSYAVREMLKGNETEFTPCEQIWDFIYADDAADAIILAAEKGQDKGIYVIGNGEARPMKEYIETVADITDYNREIGFGKLAYKDKQEMHLQADISQLESLGFTQSVTFEEGIRKMMEAIK